MTQIAEPEVVGQSRGLAASPDGAFDRPRSGGVAPLIAGQEAPVAELDRFGKEVRHLLGDRDGRPADVAWYPDDVWRYVVACDWQRIDQELPLMGRTADRGDELGSRIIAARLVDITMRLAFVLCRRWAPYSKWRVTMFRSLALPTDLGHALHDVLTANDRHSRSDRPVAALKELATIQRAIGLPSADPTCVPFWDRPYVQVDQELVPRLLNSISDPAVRALPAGVGSIEQRTDNVDLLMHAHLRRATVLGGPSPTACE